MQMDRICIRHCIECTSLSSQESQQEAAVLLVAK